MTITHPAHPRYGEKAEVIRVCKGSDPDLIVRFPDGSHSPIFASFTDYFSPTPTTTTQIENQTPFQTRGVAHEGEALLSGIVRCVRYGRKMKVHYQKVLLSFLHSPEIFRFTYSVN